MKIKKLEKRLQLNKKTVANLNRAELKKLNGGAQADSDPETRCPSQLPAPTC